MTNPTLQQRLDQLNASLAREPYSAELHNSLGAVLHEMGHREQAISAYRRSLELKPSLLSAQFNLSIALRETDQIGPAVETLRQALKLSPNHSEAWNDLGGMLLMQERFNEAAEAFQKALSRNPKFLLAWINLGNALMKLRRPRDAAVAYHQALAFEVSATIQNQLGLALLDDNQADASLAAFRAATALEPDSISYQINLGSALLRVGHSQEALNICVRILEQQPDFAGAHSNLGSALVSLGQSEKAVESFRRAIVIDPESVPAHYHLSQTLLRLGRFEEGFAELEWRKRQENILMCHGFQVPDWDGSDLAGRRILLHTEQGYGDAFQFVRYARLVQERGPREVTLLCQPELVRVLRGMEPAVRLVSHDDPPPQFDLHAPLMSLPFRCGTTLETVPAHIPYLLPEAALVKQWRSRFAAYASSLKVGLVWAGRPQHIHDRTRSISLTMLASFAQVPGIQLISLQKGPAAEQVRSTNLNLIDHTNELHDFSDTAALIQNLDLIISVDTAVVHLAGAMGKPVWVLLPFVPDWRWMQGRTDSPWYPSMRLFRQTKAGDWDSPIHQIVEALSSFKITTP